ncbi:MAG: hypothetical protein EON93_05320 [Burkholderiales bacterium]|nr:MAG: hypothetical protein EON93_05320 [Burkholderiales bacterium]
MMQADALPADVTATPRGRQAPIWLIGWVLAAAILIVQFGGEALRLQFTDPDNTMWLVSVRDVLAGQGWWDNIQHRLAPPDGTQMHWARWIATAIAAPIALLTPIVGQPTAEVIVAFAWPLALLAIFMNLIVRICGELSERDGLRTEASIAGALVAALAFPTTAKFAPGGFDHHSVELILALAGLLGLMRMVSSPRMGAVAGAALGVAMATAAEGVPFVIVGVLAAGLLWLFNPGVYARGLAWLGAGLAVSSLLTFVAMVPPSRWSAAVCDEMSTPFLGFGLAAGSIALLLGRVLPVTMLGSLPRRFAAAAVLGGVSVITLWLLFPMCAGGGYSAMSADMKAYWLVQIAEARDLGQLAGEDPSMSLGLAGAALAGLVAAGFYLHKRWRSAEGWIVLGFLVAGWAILVWQVRGAFFASAFAIPFGAWAAVRARQVWKSGTGKMGVLLFAVAAMASTSAMWSAAGAQLKARTFSNATLVDYEGRKASAEHCTASDAYASLATVPLGVMVNEFMLGPSILQRTPHAVMAAPYHRNSEGLITMITAMRSSADAAKPIVMATSADYVVVCAALPETQFYAGHPAGDATAETTLSSLLASGTPPEWLKAEPLENSPLKLYRVIR